MREAVAQLSPGPDHLLVDAVRVNWGLSADQNHPRRRAFHLIAAASIIAKVHRDEMIAAEAPVYPEYDLASNKG